MHTFDSSEQHHSLLLHGSYLGLSETKPHHERVGNGLLPRPDDWFALLHSVCDAVEVSSRTRNHEASANCDGYRLLSGAAAFAIVRRLVWILGICFILGFVSGTPIPAGVVVSSGAEASPSRDMVGFEDQGGAGVELRETLPRSCKWGVASFVRVVVLGNSIVGDWELWCDSTQYPHHSYPTSDNDYHVTSGSRLGSVGSYRSDHLARCEESEGFDVLVFSVYHGADFVHDGWLVGVQEATHLDVFKRPFGCRGEWI